MLSLNIDNSNTFIPKILAPAGCWENLQSAIKANADAIYFGIADFNMRSLSAKNFNIEDLFKIVKLCKKNNRPIAEKISNPLDNYKNLDVKTYLTLNTLMYDSDLSKMKTIVDEVKKQGITGVIVADMATIQYAFSKGVEVNISTQLSVSNIETVKFYSQWADRIVLARELSLKQIADIISQIKQQNICGPSGKLLEIEVFIHGALCVAVSGRCNMSLYWNNMSANCGKCTQVCRQKFTLKNEAGKELVLDNNYIMSSSDLCTIGLLDQIVNSGVSVLKIEGRARSSEYVYTVTKVYKQALQDILENKYTKQKIKKYTQELSTVFNRGFTQGFYMGRTFDEWAGTNVSKATIEKIQLGTVEKYFKKLNVLEMKITTPNELKIGDDILVSGSTTGVVFSKIKNLIKHIDQQNSTPTNSDNLIRKEQMTNNIDCSNCTKKQMCKKFADKLDDKENQISNPKTNSLSFEVTAVEVNSAKQGDTITFKIKEIVRKGDSVYLMRKVI